MFTRHGIERIARYGFETAMKRPRKLLASATKSNALNYSMVLWDEVVDEVAKDYPSVSWRKYHVDALAARMVTDPASIDVIVASNLFGDILTDLGAAVSGSLGIAPSGNINPERKHPSMFEPIHGSAPDIAGKGIANPIGAIWAGALMLDHLGAPRRARSDRRRDRARARRRRPAHAGSRRQGRHEDVADAIDRLSSGSSGRHVGRVFRPGEEHHEHRRHGDRPERPDHRRSHEEAHALRVVGAGRDRSDPGRRRQGLLVLDAGRASASSTSTAS